jgi:hypothetical protein
MKRVTCIIYIIYLLLISYIYYFFFFARIYILFIKMSLITTTYLKAFAVLRLLCSRLYKQVTTKLLQVARLFLANFNLNAYFSI